MTSNNKPNPIIEKIELTEEQKQEVQNIIDGKPSKQLIETWDRQGKRSKYERHYQPMGTEKDRLKKIRAKYFKGAGKCTVCQKFPLYKVIYKMEGISLVEYYCENCFDKWNKKSKK
jgi:hypothetical protein